MVSSLRSFVGVNVHNFVINFENLNFSCCLLAWDLNLYVPREKLWPIFSGLLTLNMFDAVVVRLNLPRPCCVWAPDRLYNVHDRINIEFNVCSLPLFDH